MLVTQLRHHFGAGSGLRVLVQSYLGTNVSVLVDVLRLFGSDVLFLLRDDVLLTFDEERVPAAKINKKVPDYLQLICFEVRRALILELGEDGVLLGT